MSHRTIAIPGTVRARGRGFVGLVVAAMLAVVVVVAMAPRPAAAQGLFGGSDDADRRNAEASLRINQLENQMRGLNGQIEQLSFQIRQMQDSMTRMQKDYEFRLQEIENNAGRTARPPQKKSEAPALGEAPGLTTAGLPGGNAMVGADAAPAGNRSVARGAPPAELGRLSSTDPIGGLIGSAPMDLGAPGAPSAEVVGRNGRAITDSGLAPVPGVDPRYASAPPTANPRDEYDAAYGYVLNGEYDLAETSFKTFIAHHPTDKRIGSAQFWLGESYFVRARNKEAADAFLKSYTQFPDGPKAPDSLLKLGLSLAALGEKKAACTTYEELIVKYPKAAKALRDRAMAEKSRGKC